MLVPTALLWQDDNDFQVVRPDVGNETLIKGDGHYHNLLPNLDFDIGLTDALKAASRTARPSRVPATSTCSAGRDSGNAGWFDAGGRFRPAGRAEQPGAAAAGIRQLRPVAGVLLLRQGYVSLGAFQKNVENFIGNSVENINLYGIRNQTGGPRAQQALRVPARPAHPFPIDDSALFTASPCSRTRAPSSIRRAGPGRAALANYNGSNAQHVAFATAYDILPTAEDPLYTFAVSTPVNNQNAKIHGFEFGGQYFFGDSGFGVLANYTIVRGDIGYDVTSDPNENQFALLGLSDSANAVLMFEKFGLSARLAYNWRDEYLQNLNVGQWRNPIFVEAFDQIDLNVGYDINDHFAVSFEAVNLTGEDVRWHGRSNKQMWRLEDLGPRYALGARYKF